MFPCLLSVLVYPCAEYILKHIIIDFQKLRALTITIWSHHFMANEWEKMETVTDFIFLGSKITTNSDCNHEIKRHLLLGRKAMTNKYSELNSRDITLLTKICTVKDVVFLIVMYGYMSWTINKAEHRKIDAFIWWCWRRLLRVSSNTVQETDIKTIPMEKKCKKAKWLSGEALQIAVKRKEAKSKREKERYSHFNVAI